MISSHKTRQLPEVIAIVGATATGKTNVGAIVAQSLGSEVISVDSQIVYQELKIGVNRPTEEEMLGVPHHMVAVTPPNQPFSAAEYGQMARPILERIRGEGKIPVLVGGTGFYLRALLQPAHVAQVEPDMEYRKSLKAYLAESGPYALHALLQQQDPQRAAQLHPNDTYRVIRALEIIRQTGKAITPTPVEPLYDTRYFGLTYRDRVAHVQKIRQRLEDMVDCGFLEEVETLYQRYGFCFALQHAHGYPELVDVVTGNRSLGDALNQIEINIRQYSKRQMTWFRKLPGIRWFEVDCTSQQEIVECILQDVGWEVIDHCSSRET